MSDPPAPNEVSAQALAEAPKVEPAPEAVESLASPPDDNGDDEPMDDEANADDDADDVDDTEEALFVSLEHEEEEEAARHALEQPKDAAQAPTLLRKALQEGAVKADESEDESDKDTNKPASPEPHLHARVSLLWGEKPSEHASGGQALGSLETEHLSHAIGVIASYSE